MKRLKKTPVAPSLRRFTELPPVVVVEVDDPADERAFESAVAARAQRQQRALERDKKFQRPAVLKSPSDFASPDDVEWFELTEQAAFNG